MARDARLRLATPQDAAVLSRWDAAPHLQAPLGGDPQNNGWDWPRVLADPGEWREMLIAEVGDVPIGFVQIMDPARDPGAYWGAAEPNARAVDLWIGEPAYLGRGYGRAILAAALRRAFADPVVGAVLIDPLADNHRALRFYAAAGFTAVGPRRFGADDCLVHRLDRAEWRSGDRDHA